MKTEIERVCEIMETLLAHEPIIDVPYETINDIAVALVKEGYGNIKQAQIDILNKAKEKFNAISRKLSYERDLCGVSAVCSCRCEINELIKEIEK